MCQISISSPLTLRPFDSSWDIGLDITINITLFWCASPQSDVLPLRSVSLRLYFRRSFRPERLFRTY